MSRRVTEEQQAVLNAIQHTIELLSAADLAAVREE